MQVDFFLKYCYAAFLWRRKQLYLGTAHNILTREINGHGPCIYILK